MFVDRLARGVRLMGVMSVLALAGSGCAEVSTGKPADMADAVTDLTIAASFAISDVDSLDNGFWAPEFGSARCCSSRCAAEGSSSARGRHDGRPCCHRR